MSHDIADSSQYGFFESEHAIDYNMHICRPEIHLLPCGWSSMVSYTLPRQTVF
jgi:hypothetical protein